MKQVAVILCGSGYKDGSEIRESVATLWALSQHDDVSVQCFAPQDDQFDVINCLDGSPIAGQKRNMLVESARIARGQVKPLSELKPSQYDALMIPGGFGAAKNLCTFAFKGSKGEVRADLLSVLRGFQASQKPMGAVCIAPAILALAFKDRGLELTVGAEGEASQEIQKLGHKHVVKKVFECHVDKKNKCVTTPAYMYDNAHLAEVFMGVKKCVDEVVKLA